MSDFFVELSKNPTAVKVIRMLRLPVPLPPRLKRAKGPWEEKPLLDLLVMVGAVKGHVLSDVLSDVLVQAGADTTLVGDSMNPEAYQEKGEAWGRCPKTISLDALPEHGKPHGLVMDALNLEGPEDLKAIYDFFHATVRTVASSGRVIVLARPADSAQCPRKAAALRSLEGFVRSVGKEVGRKGSTATLVWVESGAEERLVPVLRFFLSHRAAYISGQPLRISASVSWPQDVPLVRPLEGKVALITGAARGIGAATAETMAREGAHVIVMDLPSDEEAAQVLATKLGGTALACDMTSEQAGSVIQECVRSSFKGLDIVVHNAGVTRDKTLGNMDDSRWDMVMNVNLISLMRVNEEIQPLIPQGGRILCLSSIAGIGGNVGQTNYAASKAGVIGYVQSVAPAMALKGITVNAMAPGFIETRMTAAIPPVTRFMARRLCSLSQGGLPQDVAETATFLASPGAAGITGQVLRVCGGNFVGA